MQYNIEPRSDSIIVADLSSQLTSEDDRTMRKMVDELDAIEATTVILNLKQVTYMDSIAMGLLLYARKQTLAANKELILESPSQKVQECESRAKEELVHSK